MVPMTTFPIARTCWFLAALSATTVVGFAQTAAPAPAAEDFAALTKRLEAEKPKFAQRQ